MTEDIKCWKAVANGPDDFDKEVCDICDGEGKVEDDDGHFRTCPNFNRPGDEDRYEETQLQN